MSKLLSIVVPTKNRYEYLFQLIELLSTFEDNGFEMVIQDNSDDNTEFNNRISLEKYPFIQYFYIKESLSQSANSDQSILNSTGEYVCFIGDDDGVTRNVVEAVRWMKRNNFTILKSATSVFKWPSFVSPKGYDVSGTLHYNDYTHTYKKVDCSQALSSLLSSGMESLGGMPKVYNGIVKRSVLDKIYAKCGTFFPGPSPDMANAVSLALTEQSYVYVDSPIIIGGHSVNLGSNAARYKKGIGPLEEQSFIDQKYKDSWGERIPKIWASQTVWPESARTALVAFQREDLLSQINYEAILRKFVVDYWEYAWLAFPLSESKIKLFFSCLYHSCIKWLFGIVNRYQYHHNGVFGGLRIHEKISNLIDAEEVFYQKNKEFRLTKAN